MFSMVDISNVWRLSFWSCNGHHDHLSTDLEGRPNPRFPASSFSKRVRSIFARISNRVLSCRLFPMFFNVFFFQCFWCDANMLTGSCFFARFFVDVNDVRSPRDIPSIFDAVCGRLAVLEDIVCRGVDNDCHADWWFLNIFTGSDLRGVLSRLENACVGVVALVSMGDLRKFPGFA